MEKLLAKADVSRREARDAARLAIQSAIAAALMFIVMQAAGLPEKFVGILSAVLVVQPSVGNTLGEASDRFVSTLVGSAIGIVCLILLPGGYGTAAALALSMLVVNGVAGLRPEWRYGVVAAVALSLGGGEDPTQTAIDRSLAIGLGCVLGIVVTLAVWPDTAEKRAKRHLREALLSIVKRLEGAIGGVFGEDAGGDTEVIDKFHEDLDSARAAAKAVYFGDKAILEKRVVATEELYNSVLIINRVAEEIAFAANQADDLYDRVNAIREAGCALIKNFADGEAAQEKEVQSIRKEFETIRTSADDKDDDPRAHVLRNAMIFGLGEVVDGLQKLAETFSADAENDS